jgi:CHAT domain-containing protein
MLGLDDDQRLVRVTAHDGQVELPVRESADVFSSAAFERWSQQYPYRYAYLDTAEAIASNEARVSVMQLGLGEIRCVPTMVVPAVGLAAFPANLLFLNDDFAGRQMPMAAVPSLSWLARSRQQHRSRNGRRIAWISTQHDETSPGTLLQVAERLREPLTNFGIDLRTTSSAPPEMRGADLVVLGAHGGLVPEERFFQVVADERSLRLSARHLAGLVGEAGIAILFICSAGRADVVPFASATVGLAKLMLDSGCRAVVASPWPLDARVPAHWMPAFLRASAEGATLGHATFAANHAVSQALGNVVTHALAMHVIGDPDVAPVEWMST